MTIDELIQELQQFPPQSEIWIADHSNKILVRELERVFPVFLNSLEAKGMPKEVLCLQGKRN